MFGVTVGRQLNLESPYDGGVGARLGDDTYRMTDEEYYKRYGRHRGAVNFLKERK